MTQESLIVICNQCKTKNRIPANKLADNPICGKCKAPLPAAYNYPVDVTDNTFQQEVLDYQGSILIDCWAPWCGPCKAIGPVMEQLTKEYSGKIKIAKLNTDINQATASKYAIMSIPSLLFFKNGQLKETLVGAHPKSEIEKTIGKLIN